MSMESRPPIAPSSGWLERILGIGALAAVSAVLGVALWAWPNLPKVIPIHFGFDGRPDGWGSRSTFWLLPIVGVALYVALTVLANFPHRYNYPWPITDTNAARQYLLARRLVLSLRLVIALIFLHLVYGTASVAQGSSAGLELWGLASGLIAVPLILGLYLVVGWRAR